MPKLISDPVKAAALVQEKQQLEVSLAWDLLDTFNKNKDLIGPLRERAGLAIEEMFCLTGGKDGIGEAAIDGAIKKEIGAMSLLKKPRATSKLKDDGTVKTKMIDSPKKLKLLLSEVPKLDAQEVSDVIRLYGTFVEFAAKDPKLKAFYENVEAKQKSYRKGIKDGDTVWRDDRARGPVALKDEEKAGLSLDERVQWIAIKAGQFESAMRGNAQQFLVSMEGGQSVWALKDSSTIGKLDDAFGLVPASDISGTTTDTIFFFSKFPGIDPLFQMLPLATIVAGAHHSMIEVAMPLSINGIIDYHLGFYTTLLPAKSKHSAVGAISKTLKMAEDEPRNHFLLAWRDKKGVAGCYQFTPDEKPAFEAFRKFTNGKKLMAIFKGLKEVDKATVEDLVAKHGLAGKGK
jgi:hypothetical protein